MVKLLLPPDGLNQIEMEIVATGKSRLYQKLGNDRLRFLMAMVFELGYRQEDVAYMLKISQPAISQQLDTIRKQLDSFSPSYKAEIKLP